MMKENKKYAPGNNHTQSKCIDLYRVGDSNKWIHSYIKKLYSLPTNGREYNKI